MNMSYELMHEVVSLGANLVIENPVASDHIRELVSIAAHHGSHITLRISLSADLVRELASLGTKHITLVNG